MKTIIHKKIDNGVAVQRISDKHLALVTGRGLGWNNQQIAREIEKLSIDYQTYPLIHLDYIYLFLYLQPLEYMSYSHP